MEKYLCDIKAHDTYNFLDFVKNSDIFYLKILNHQTQLD